MLRFAVFCLVALLVPGASARAQGSLAVAAASDLQAVLPELAARFQKETGTQVKVSYGSSGNFFAQIQNGAPFDIFLSADVDYPRRLLASGHAERGSLHHYATGRIVLWMRRESGIDVSRGLAVLRDSRIRRVAIANPAHAPYGRAAVAAMRAASVYDAVRGKLVLGENISQTAQFVDSGNADAGILALSLALGPALRARGHYVEIPSSSHPPIEQAAVIVAASRQKAAARRFIDYLRSPEIVKLLASFGFSVAAGAR